MPERPKGKSNVLPAAVPPSKAVKNLIGAVETLNRKMNVSIDEHTPALWDTGTMDFSESVEQLQIVDGRFMHQLQP